MRLGRFTLHSQHFLRSAVGLAAVAVLAVYSGGSVPNDMRRYIVTPQELSPAELQAAIATHTQDDWQQVGSYVADNGLLDRMDGRERALIRASYKQELQQANAENAIRQRIRVPLLPGPVKGVAIGPVDKPAPAASRTITDAPAAARAPAAATAAVHTTPLAEDLATIEALKAALKDLKADGLLVGKYRNDIADQ